jgi:peptidoglycan/xylan/chitin deacetylase (PgdA/CDA1 family)
MKQHYYPILAGILAIPAIVIIGNAVGRQNPQARFSSPIVPSTPALAPTSTPTPTLLPTPTPTPTSRPLTLAERQLKYGPCATIPTLLYHHVQEANTAKANHQTTLTVTPDFFRRHLQYLKDHNYQPITPKQLLAFFNSKTPLPPKPVLLTFDDGYEDLYTTAFPVLKKYHYPAVVFVITGLVDNPGYLSWNQIEEMAAAGIFFGNHTWSHHGAWGDRKTLEKEITTAGRQLAEHNLNLIKTFAYPYGSSSNLARQVLSQNGYKIAFTTHPGKILCQAQRLLFPRIRIGNAPLSAYGL